MSYYFSFNLSQQYFSDNATVLSENKGRKIFWKINYNKRIDGKYPKHPAFVTFVDTLKSETVHQVRKWQSIQAGNIEPRKRGAVHWPKMPNDYADFVRARVAASIGSTRN